MGYHRSGCRCPTDTFISKAHTNFTSILIEAQSQEEFVRRVKALPRHAVDDHSQCDYHLVACEPDSLYRTKFRKLCSMR